MLARRVEVDVVGDVEREAHLRVGDARAVVRASGRDRVTPRCRARGHERVQRRLREHVAQAAQVDDLPALGPREAPVGECAEPGHRIPSSCSSPTGSKNEQLPIECSRCVRTCSQLAGAGSAAVPAERLGVELECSALRAQRVLLVGEDARCEQVEEPMLARVGPIRVMQPRRRLEDDAALAAAAHERRQFLHGRDRGTAAADLRGPLDVEVVALALGAAADDRELTTLDLDALGHDEAAEEPRVRARLRARVLGERVRQRHARRREQRRMVEEPAQKRPA